MRDCRAAAAGQSSGALAQLLLSGCYFECSMGQQIMCLGPCSGPGLIPGAAGPDSEAALPMPTPEARGPLVLLLAPQAESLDKLPLLSGAWLLQKDLQAMSLLLPQPPPMQKARATTPTQLVLVYI